MWHIEAINLQQLLASAYAIRRGGAPERIVGLAMVLAAVATFVLGVHFGQRHAVVEIGILIVDLALLATLLALVLYADRYWTIWMAAMQGLGSLAHLVRAALTDELAIVYVTQLAAWSYPMVLLLIVAPVRHDRRRGRNGYDLDWSRQDSTLT